MYILNLPNKTRKLMFYIVYLNCKLLDLPILDLSQISLLIGIVKLCMSMIVTPSM